MSTQTDQRKNVRIVAQSNSNSGVLKSVNIVTAQDAAREIKEHVQMTAAQWALTPGEIPTYMDASAHPLGLPTIFISGYAVPN